MATKTISFTVHSGGKAQKITSNELESYAEMLGLNRIALGRYSWLFIIDILLFEKINGIDPYAIIDEINALEGLRPKLKTKPPSQFKHNPLKGLWHKHFFSARFVVHNIVNELAVNRLPQIIEEILDPNKSPIITRDMINELAHRVTVEQFEKRDKEGRLTGEWIIFAKHNEKNYYLTLCPHKTGDQSIYDRIRSLCFPQFPFLQREKT